MVGRVCLDVLRSRTTRPETSYEDRLLDPTVTWRTYHPQGVVTTVGASDRERLDAMDLPARPE